MAEDVVLVGGARTPFCEWVGGKRGDGKPGGLLKTVSAQELGSIAIKGALEKTNTAPESVDHVVMGYALQTCSQSIYGARHAGLKAGIPQEVPMLTLSRICGSGIQSIVTGAQMIMLDEASTVVAGGMENLSQAPHVLRGARDGWKLGRSPPVEDYMMTNLQDMTCGKFMAQTSDEICARKGVTREETDAFAARSHQRTLASIENGVFDDEIVDVVIKSRRGEKVITAKDEDHVVRDTSPESLSKLPTAFGPTHLLQLEMHQESSMGRQRLSSNRLHKQRQMVTNHLLVSLAGELSDLNLQSWHMDLCQHHAKHWNAQVFPSKISIDGKSTKHSQAKPLPVSRNLALMRTKSMSTAVQ